ncbi:hypothetical protein THRCLA_02717 [Thraustotheca clavata]|uniref:F-box domain-containing protein n=1 Tax=Thraustotheca clavata TaxID=74557 RepID=A0A1W0A4Z4_9STRA|nr:hypothetical protein THRCLA_02717 [Thraustotheca clavata]
MLSSILWTHVLSFLDDKALINVFYTSKGMRMMIKKQICRWKEIQIGIGMAKWIQKNVEIVIQVHVQEMQNQTIRRSVDMRVPPRVQSVWIERGTIESEESRHGVVGSFYVAPNQRLIHVEFDCSKSVPRPMALHTINLARTLYTTLSLMVCGKEIRRHLYHKQIGDLEAINIADKYAWTQAGGVMRYDVANRDKTCQLKLGLPAHLDGMVDCYYIDMVACTLHKHELFPVQYYNLDVSPMSTNIHLEFCNLTQDKCFVRKSIPCEFNLEIPQSNSMPPNQENPETRTGIENFEIARFKSTFQPILHDIAFLSTPGRIAMTIRHSGKDYYHAVMFHNGTRSSPSNNLTLEAFWVPGVLEYSMFPDTLDRRLLKGTFSCELAADGALISLVVLAQHLSIARLQRYAARISSYCRKEV